MAVFIKLLDEPVSESIVERMLFMAEPEEGRSKSIYFNGYGGKWCHRFADWLAMNAGQPKDMLPNTANCGKGIVWFASDEHSSSFFFRHEEHKTRMLKAYSALVHLSPTLTTTEAASLPSPGDYVYFRWKNAASSVNVSHVGIVAAVDEDRLVTWEGNAGSKVAQHTYSLSDAQIVGYGRLKYKAPECSH